MLIHPSPGAFENYLLSYFMGCIALVWCVLVLRCDLPGVVWCGIRMQTEALVFFLSAIPTGRIFVTFHIPDFYEKFVSTSRPYLKSHVSLLTFMISRHVRSNNWETVCYLRGTVWGWISKWRSKYSCRDKYKKYDISTLLGHQVWWIVDLLLGYLSDSVCCVKCTGTFKILQPRCCSRQ